MNDVTLRRFEASDADWLVGKHAELYSRDEGFDDSFGPLVASILRDFVAGHDPTCERGWIAMAGDRRLGSIFCVKQSEGVAKLRLFLLLPEARGLGLGRRLLRSCMTFAAEAGYAEMQLWTHESHQAACALYAAFGWQLVDSKPVRSFGVDLVEQSWKVSLSPLALPEELG
jgi:GNAT superfamily N-acetyltransferase